MHELLTARFPDRPSAEVGYNRLMSANMYVHDIHMEDESGGVALKAYVQPEELERALAVVRGERAPNDPPPDPELHDGNNPVKGGRDGTNSIEQKLRPANSATAPRDYGSGAKRSDD